MANALQALDVDVQLIILDIFTFNNSRRDVNGRLIRQLLADDDLGAKVREIRILWAPSTKLQHGEGSKGDLELLGQALPRLTGLKTFIWDAHYPILSWLLEILQTHHPQCSLYTRHPASQGSAQTLPRLCGSPCLFSLDVTLTIGQFQAFKELQKVLTSALNLRDLTITSTFNSPYVSPYQEQEEPEPLQLRSLELDGPLFITFKLPVAWPILERLSLGSLFYLPSFSSDIAGLKSLRLRIGDLDEIPILSSILQRCKKLEVLDLTGPLSGIQMAEEDFWENVGRGLTKLRLHEDDNPDRVGKRPYLSTMDMGRMAKCFPNLHSLGLDIHCNGKEWPYTMLKHIANDFWFLVHLELNVLIENPQHDHPTSPKAILDSVPEIWTCLWQEITHSRARRGHSIAQPRLRSLDLIAGSYPSSEDWCVDQQRFTFDLSDRDDEARLGIAHVNCTEVKALLSKLSPAGPLWTHQQELIMNTANERARKGPHIKMPSVMDREMVRPSPFWDRLDQNRFYYR
ncbi:MAG: hypothetical protein ALECFALPRED_006341 [Alectoria fallacina]|uniref:Uncharacterized protein n=1 Tax=Alectoria fallacina TaxID=1903189 RepID=A0A8H3FZM8_9LECA|nr:MAG: hypothetical protein ALECFALPRED_006341 [Alectoria fallacina]